MPITAEWLDKDSRVELKRGIELKVAIAECKTLFTVTFLIVPWEMDFLVVGWETLQAEGLLRTLEDHLQVQKSMNVSVGMVHEEVDMVIEDMDGRRVTSDSLRWPEDGDDASDPGSEAGKDGTSVLDKEQQGELDALLIEFDDVFQDLPAGSALVEPMSIRAKPG